MLIYKSNHCLPLNFLSKRVFCSKFPFKFGNQKTLNELTIEPITQKETLEGFKYIYRNFIEAINDKDEEYIEKVCEETFAKKLIESIKDEKVYLNDIGESDKSVKIEKINFELYYGIKTNREENRKQGVKKEREFQLPFTHIKPKVIMHMGPFNTYVVFRLIVDFRTNIILDEQPISDETKSEVHSIIFENESQDQKVIFHILDQTQASIFQKLMFSKKKNLDWKISDFDNFMGGNPLL